VNTRQNLDQRRLAGAVLAEQGHDFTAPDRHADVVESLSSAEAPGNAIDPKQRGVHALRRPFII
jgi:hypothetical protein